MTTTRLPNWKMLAMAAIEDMECAKRASSKLPVFNTAEVRFYHKCAELKMELAKLIKEGK